MSDTNISQKHPCSIPNSTKTPKNIHLRFNDKNCKPISIQIQIRFSLLNLNFLSITKLLKIAALADQISFIN